MADCEICGHRSSGDHYGADSRSGSCRRFFHCGIGERSYYATCKLPSSESFQTDKRCRNTCQHYPVKRCVGFGMREEDLKPIERRRKVHNLPHSKFIPPKFNSESHFREMIERDEKRFARVACPRVVFDYRRESPTDYPEPAMEPAENHTETASRWLFMTIKWAKSLPYFAELYYPDQLELLRQNWSKLFLFNLMYVELVPSMEEQSEDGIDKVFKELFTRWSQLNLRPDIPGKFDYSLEKIRRLKMDETEALLIKSLLLFNPETEGLVDASQVQVTQNKCHRALEEHTSSTNPGERGRSGRILLTILTLSSFEERDIESIFLSAVLGNATVTSLMENILCAEPV